MSSSLPSSITEFSSALQPSPTDVGWFFFLSADFTVFFGNIYVRKRGFSFDEASWILFSKSISRTDFGHFLRIFLLGCKREGSRLGSAFALRNSVRFLFSFFFNRRRRFFSTEGERERTKKKQTNKNQTECQRVASLERRIESKLVSPRTSSSSSSSRLIG